MASRRRSNSSKRLPSINSMRASARNRGSPLQGAVSTAVRRECTLKPALSSARVSSCTMPGRSGPSRVIRRQLTRGSGGSPALVSAAVIPCAASALSAAPSAACCASGASTCNTPAKRPPKRLSCESSQLPSAASTAWLSCSITPGRSSQKKLISTRVVTAGAPLCPTRGVY